MTLVIGYDLNFSLIHMFQVGFLANLGKNNKKWNPQNKKWNRGKSDSIKMGEVNEKSEIEKDRPYLYSLPAIQMEKSKNHKK